MKKVFSVLPSTSAVIATIFLNLSPALAQVNSADNSINSQIGLDLPDEKDVLFNIKKDKNIPTLDIDTLNQAIPNYSPLTPHS